MKMMFLLSAILGLFFVFGANAQSTGQKVVKTTKTATSKTVKGTKKGYSVTKEVTVAGAKKTNKGVRKAYGKTKRFSKVAARKTKNASVKGYKGTKKVVKKVF
jgi:hypothetical protein